MKFGSTRFLAFFTLALAATVVALFLQINLLRAYGKERISWDQIDQQRSVGTAGWHGRGDQHDYPLTLPIEDCSAEAIIQKTYNEVFRPFVESCPRNVSAAACMKNYLGKTRRQQQQQQQDNPDDSNDPEYTSSSSTLLPWWFESLLSKSSQKNKVNSPVHKMYFDDPPLKFCTIEKIGTLTWRELRKDFYDGRKGIRAETVEGVEVPHAVFTRDPLERFLSGYIDKCVNHLRHLACEPLGLYMNGEVKKHFSNRQLFDSFVSAVPFGWNLHFVPQSLFCNGLFRDVDRYDFIGSMDSDRFLADLKRFQHQFQGNLSRLVQEKFLIDELEKKQTADITKILEEHQNNHYTGATKQVAAYYTADTIRQVLKYTAIDYVSLNLTVPQWAQEMLTEDCLRRESVMSQLS